jgi:hypothetical protein
LKATVVGGIIEKDVAKLPKNYPLPAKKQEESVGIWCSTREGMTCVDVDE